MKFSSLLILLALASPVCAQSPGGFLPGQVLTAAELNTAFENKTDYAGGAVVTAFGAKCDGATDDTVALNSALSSGQHLVFIPNATCFSATGITVPPGVALMGMAWIGGADPTSFSGGSRIACPTNLANPCIEAGAPGGAVSTGSVSNLIVQGVGSATLTQGIGIRIDGLFGATLNQTMVFNFWQGYYWKAYNINGLGGKMWQAYSGRIKDAHVIVDSWPELQIAQSRFGMRGTSDLGAATFVRFQSAALANPAAAANTFDCMNCQFNEGNGALAVNHWLEFVNFPSGFPTNDAEIFRFTNNHVENVNFGLFSDASWNFIYNFRMTSSSLVVFNNIFAHNASTNLVNVNFTGNTFVGPMTLNATAQLRGFSLLGNYFTDPVTLTGNGTGGRVMAAGNSFQNGLNIGGNGWLSINLVGNESSMENIPALPSETGNLLQLDGSNSRLAFTAVQPTITMTDRAAGVTDGLNWDLNSNMGTFSLRAVNDNYSASSVPFSCTRAGAAATGCNIQFPASSNGAVTQTFATSPCAAPASRWVPITIAGQVGTWFIPACK